MWRAVRPPLSTPVTRRKTVGRTAGQDVFSTVATRDAIHPDLPCATYRPRLADKGLCTRWPMAAPVQVLPDWRCPPSVARWWATKTQPREVMRVQPYSALSSASPLPRLFDDVRPIQPSTGGCSSPLCSRALTVIYGRRSTYDAGGGRSSHGRYDRQERTSLLQRSLLGPFRGGLAKLQGFTENDLLMKIIGAHNVQVQQDCWWSTQGDFMSSCRPARIVSDASSYDMLRER